MVNLNSDLETLYFLLSELQYMEAMCSWNKTWEVGSNDMDCYKQFCQSPEENLLKTFSTEDWCPGGITKKASNESHKWEWNHKMDAAERHAVERLCRWNTLGEGYSLDMVECYATHCASPNTTVNELYNYNYQWQETDPMTPVETFITYPCQAGTKMMDMSLWWKEDAEDHVDVYCGLDGEYQYPDPWLNCFPGKMEHLTLEINQMFPDNQVECPAPSPKPGVIFEDETSDIEDFQYGSIIR